MESGGRYSPGKHPGEGMLIRAKELSKDPDFQVKGAHEAFFDWDSDVIILLTEDGQELKRIPLRQTLAEYEERLK